MKWLETIAGSHRFDEISDATKIILSREQACKIHLLINVDTKEYENIVNKDHCQFKLLLQSDFLI